MEKRLLRILAVLAAVCALTACTRTEIETAPPSGPEPETASEAENPGFFVWGDYAGEFDLKAEAYYLWDENYLYVCTIVTDDDVMDVGEDRYDVDPANWQADAVEKRENDGLVNTVSAMAPSGAPSKPLDRTGIEPGIWNVFPTFDGDHMSLQGGLTRRHGIGGFYEDLLRMIESLPEVWRSSENP